MSSTHLFPPLWPMPLPQLWIVGNCTWDRRQHAGSASGSHANTHTHWWALNVCTWLEPEPLSFLSFLCCSIFMYVCPSYSLLHSSHHFLWLCRLSHSHWHSRVQLQDFFVIYLRLQQSIHPSDFETIDDPCGRQLVRHYFTTTERTGFKQESDPLIKSASSLVP